MLWVPFAFAMGCAIYFALPWEPGGVFLIGCLIAPLLLLAVIWRVPVRFKGLPEFALILLSFMILGLCYSAFRAHTMAGRSIPSPLERVMVEGWVTEVSGRSDRQRLEIRVHAISDVMSEDLPMSVRMSQRPDEEMLPGRFVRCFGTLQPPPRPLLNGDYDFERNAFFEGLGAVGFVFGQCRPGRMASQNGWFNSVKNWVNAQRNQFARYVSERSGNGAGLAAALLTGDRSFLTEEHEEILRASGLAHLLAISGLHMSLAAGVFYFGLFRILALIPAIALRVPIQKVASMGALIAVTAYLIFSGSSVATQRAYIMVVSVMVYTLFDRPLLSFQALAIAMMAVLLLAPWSVSTPGFQMSFAATAALLAGLKGGKKETQRKTWWIQGALQFIEGLVRTSWIAGLATLPFALFHFGRAAPLGFFANILVMPVVTLICVPIAAIAAVLIPFGIAEIPLEALSFTLGWVLDIAAQFTSAWSGWRHLLPDQMPVISLMLLTFSVAVWAILQKHRILISVLFIVWGGLAWRSEPDPIAVYDGAGHLFVETETNWIELDLGNRGLGPLRFSEVEAINCRNACSLEMTAGTSVLVEGQNSVQFQTGEEVFEISLNSETSGFDLVREQVGFTIIQHASRACRIWSSDYVSCR